MRKKTTKLLKNKRNKETEMKYVGTMTSTRTLSLANDTILSLKKSFSLVPFF